MLGAKDEEDKRERKLEREKLPRPRQIHPKISKTKEHSHTEQGTPGSVRKKIEIHVPLLDIKPEGELEREIKDIVEELTIMIHIHKTQRDMFKQFINHVERILDPSGTLIAKHCQDRKMGKSARHTAVSRRASLAGSPLTSPTEIPADKTTYFGNKLPIDVRPVSPTLPSSQSATFPIDAEADRAYKYDGFKIKAQEMFIRINDRTEQLEELAKNAETTAASVGVFSFFFSPSLQDISLYHANHKIRSRICSSSNSGKPALFRHGRPLSKAM